jgi:hypothetical protein
MVRFLKNLSKVFVITFFFFAPFFQTASASIMEFLDDYEEVVSVYEKYANKDKLCTSDMLKLNTEILPKLMPLMQQVQTQQSNFTSTELQRYMEIMTRYSGAMMKLGPKMENVTC